MGFGFRIPGFEFRVLGSGFRIHGLAVKFPGSLTRQRLRVGGVPLLRAHFLPLESLVQRLVEREPPQRIRGPGGRVVFSVLSFPVLSVGAC